MLRKFKIYAYIYPFFFVGTFATAYVLTATGAAPHDVPFLQAAAILFVVGAIPYSFGVMIIQLASMQYSFRSVEPLSALIMWAVLSGVASQMMSFQDFVSLGIVFSLVLPTLFTSTIFVFVKMALRESN